MSEILEILKQAERGDIHRAEIELGAVIREIESLRQKNAELAEENKRLKAGAKDNQVWAEQAESDMKKTAEERDGMAAGIEMRDGVIEAARLACEGPSYSAPEFVSLMANLRKKGKEYDLAKDNTAKAALAARDAEKAVGIWDKVLRFAEDTVWNRNQIIEYFKIMRAEAAKAGEGGSDNGR